MVQRLADRYDVYFLSNRNEGSQLATERWVAEHILDNPEVVCTMDSKSNWLKDTSVLLDDRPKTLVEFIYSYGPEDALAFGKMYEYNRSLTDLEGIWLSPTWGGIEDYLEVKGVLNG